MTQKKFRPQTWNILINYSELQVICVIINSLLQRENGILDTLHFDLLVSFVKVIPREEWRSIQQVVSLSVFIIALKSSLIKCCARIFTSFASNIFFPNDLFSLTIIVDDDFGASAMRKKMRSTRKSSLSVASGTSSRANAFKMYSAWLFEVDWFMKRNSNYQ